MLYGMALTTNAYAKINLYLDVTSRRLDGFHDIKSIMQTLSLADTVSLELTREENDMLTCNIPDIPTDGKNIAIKAVNAFRKATGLVFGTKIHIEKNIPSAAGLAGGSSDGSAVLRLLRTLTELDISSERLIKIAASVGADLPFCLVGGTVLAEGKGEKLSAIGKCPMLHCVVAIKGEGVSTPMAYGELDRLYGEFEGERDGGKYSRLTEALYCSNTSAVCANLYNIFESVTEPIRPEVAGLKGHMKELGALAALMSGSGPSVFGFFPDEETARVAVQKLTEYGASAYYCTT